MANKLQFSESAINCLEKLQKDSGQTRILKAVLKTLGFMKTNLRHPSLRTHEITRFKGPEGQKVFEAYAQQNTPGAYRVFWFYAGEKNSIFILAILPHPD